MRFSDLKIGDHFYFEGLEHTKTSPVLARDANGNSRFIPRSAVLQAHPAQKPQTIPIEVSDVDRLYQAVTTLIRREVHDVELETKLRQAIEQAWRDINESK